jgi:serralysin
MSSTLSLSGYHLTFDDEFSSATNSDIGTPGTPGIKWETEPFYGNTSNGGQGTINPTPPGQSGSSFSLENGSLVLSMNPSQAQYLDTNPSGVQGGFSQQYGYFEVRAQLTGTSGYNADFWMIPTSGSSPPEIDIFEHNGYIPGDYEMTNHSSSAPVSNLDLYEVPGITTGFHDFGLMWTPDTLTWYIDGQEAFSTPTTSDEHQPFSLILSGGPSYQPWLPVPADGTSDQYKIQWVHAYSNDSNATGIAGMSGYQDHDGSVSLGGSSVSTTSGSGTFASSSTDGSGSSGVSTGGGGSSGSGSSTNGSGSSGSTVSSTVASITPASGSLTDAAGNVYTIDPSGIAMENGSPIAGGSGTGAMQYVNGTVYGQDAASGLWYTWNQASWTPSTAPTMAPLAAPLAAPTSAAGPVPSVTETSDHGSLQKNLSDIGTYTVGDDTLVLSSSGMASVNLGTGTSNIAFVDPNSLSVTGGSGTATVTANAGTNTFTAGAGSLDVTGGSGSDTYVFHTGSGLLTIEDFSADTGDKLVLDSALQASMVQSSDNQGGTLITFGSGATQAIDLRGVGAIPNGAIAWA